MAALTALGPSDAGAPAPPPSVIGPNAVLQLQAALETRFARAGAEQIFSAAGHERLLRTPPREMVDEAIPAALFRALWRELPARDASSIAHDAGQRTGNYILANRIPSPAKWVLKALPARYAAPLLLQAIRKNAWTFAGSGTCTVETGSPTTINIAANPLSMPGCVWHIGVFQQLFRALVHPRTQIAHADRIGADRRICRFEIAWPGSP